MLEKPSREAKGKRCSKGLEGEAVWRMSKAKCPMACIQAEGGFFCEVSLEWDASCLFGDRGLAKPLQARVLTDLPRLFCLGQASPPKPDEEIRNQ
jgi:hypothetical protein